MRFSMLPLLMLAVASVPAIAADRVAADDCAAKLDPDAKSIYVAAVPAMKPGANLRRVLTHVVMPKVMSGTLTRTTAPPLAEQASRCLELMQ